MRHRKPKWAQTHHTKPRRVGGRRERARLRALRHSRSAYA